MPNRKARFSGSAFLFKTVVADRRWSTVDSPSATKWSDGCSIWWESSPFTEKKFLNDHRKTAKKPVVRLKSHIIEKSSILCLITKHQAFLNLTRQPSLNNAST